jgi:ABC-type glycerol-3-phosphate transport system substrate-binding protein
MRPGLKLMGKAGLILAVTALIIWSVLLYIQNAGLIRVGELKINPSAEIDPNRRYEITLWEQPIYLPLLDQKSRQTALEAAATELNQVYPNITVDVKILEDASSEYLLQALEAGVGPDIVGIAHIGLLLDETGQIPITSYITEEAREDLLPAVKNGISYKNQLWVWPKWVSNPVWLGHFSKVSLIHDSLSISARSFIEQANHYRIKLGYNAYDPSFFYNLITSGTGKPMFSSEGVLYWTENDLLLVATFLSDLQKEGIMSKAVEEEARTRLSRFWTNQLDMIAPINYPLLHHAFSRTGEITYEEVSTGHQNTKQELILLSSPYLYDYHPGVSGSMAGYAVLVTNKSDSDHVKASMIVAEHLSKRVGLWEASKILAVPAYTSAFNQWQRATGLPLHYTAFLQEIAARTVPPPIKRIWAETESEAMERVVQPALLRLLEGSITPEEFAGSVINELDAFVISNAPK